MINLSYPTLDDAYSVGIAWGAKNRDIYAASNNYRHTGIDLTHRGKNTPIYAMADGIVEWAGYESAHGYGRHILLRHSVQNIFYTRYAHLLEINVREGEMVQAGEIIGIMGGMSSDPYRGVSGGKHLHLELLVPDMPNQDFIYIKWADLYSVDPFSWLSDTFLSDNPELKVISKVGINIRKAPELTGKKLGALPYNKVCKFTSTRSDNKGNTWARLASLRSEWVCIKFGNEILAEVSEIDIKDDVYTSDIYQRLDDLEKRVERLESL